MTIVFLQNAWSPMYAGGSWPRDSWLRALAASRSGQRLRVMTAECSAFDFWFDNTTPIVGDTPSSVVPADLDHMRAVINEQRPTQIVAAGRLASSALDSLEVKCPQLHIPHPAMRVLTNDLYACAGKLLAKQINGRIVLTQRRGTFEISHSAVTVKS